MPKPETTLLISSIVPELYDLDAQIEALKAKLAAKQKELMELGDGTYIEPSGTRKALVATPSAPKASYTLYPEAAKKAFLAARDAKKATPSLFKEFAAEQETKARELAGEHFPTLFDHVVVKQPAKGFEDMIPRLFKTATATAKKLLLLCQVCKAAGSQYVKLTDKPKKTDEESEAESEAED